MNTKALSEILPPELQSISPEALRAVLAQRISEYYQQSVNWHLQVWTYKKLMERRPNAGVTQEVMNVALQNAQVAEECLVITKELLLDLFYTTPTHNGKVHKEEDFDAL